MGIFFEELKYCLRMGLRERKEKNARKEREEVRMMSWWGWDERRRREGSADVEKGSEVERREEERRKKLNAEKGTKWWWSWNRGRETERDVEKGSEVDQKVDEKEGSIGFDQTLTDEPEPSLWAKIATVVAQPLGLLKSNLQSGHKTDIVSEHFPAGGM